MQTRIAYSIVLGAVLGLLAGCQKTDTPPVAADEGQASPVAATQDSAPPKPVLDDLHPEVVLKTSLGEISIKLNAEKAPLTVKNFLAYVNTGHYDGTIFHQVEDGFIVLGGGYTPELGERPVMMSIRNEANNGLKNIRGTVAMARHPDAVDSATSQFFINVADNVSLNYKSDDEFGYCVFGEVVSGLEVVENISKSKAEQRAEFANIPVETVAIQSARRIR